MAAVAALASVASAAVATLDLYPYYYTYVSCQPSSDINTPAYGFSVMDMTDYGDDLTLDNCADACLDEYPSKPWAAISGKYVYPNELCRWRGRRGEARGESEKKGEKMRGKSVADVI